MVYYGCLLTVHKANTHAHIHLGLALAAAGQETAAHSMFAHALSLNPFHADAVPMHASIHAHKRAHTHVRALSMPTNITPHAAVQHGHPPCTTCRVRPCRPLVLGTRLHCHVLSHLPTALGVLCTLLVSCSQGIASEAVRAALSRPTIVNTDRHLQTGKDTHTHACARARAHTHTHIHTLNSHTLSPTTSLSVILNLRLWWTFDLSGSTPTSTYTLVLPSPSERTGLATAGVSWG